MSRRRRLSTSTVIEDGRTVPWLAAVGPLAYTPETPPESDYYFQYGWVMPGTLSDGVSRRRHYYFGALVHDQAERVFAFWDAARARAVTRVALLFGRTAAASVHAPIAVYACRVRGEGVYVLMQHGSYQVIEIAQQPLIDSGDVLLYRGIEQAGTFRFDRTGPRDEKTELGRVFERYARTQAHVLSDSTRSFNSIHDRAKRTETGHIRDGTWLTDQIARDQGLDLARDGLAKQLWRTTHQSFTLAEDIAKWKFGPNYIKCRTPLDNIRLTTFFAGEHEARIIDPDRVEFLECVGCRLDDAPVDRGRE